MALNTENVRLVFGLKLKQLRLDKGLSLHELSQKSGLSISYINEIEKGKKYPKSDKIIALADAMEVEYDSLVSLKLNKRLEPISELLDSNILTELPLELFGIDPATLLQLLSDAPTKISAFIGTLIEISKKYNMSVEQFYFSALRTYQEMYDNYFEDLELEASLFLEEFGIPEEQLLDEEYLTNLLISEYGYQIEEIDESKMPDLTDVRSLLIPNKKRNLLLINKKLNKTQRTFILGREVGYQYLHLMKKRLLTTALVEAESFEQLLNNYKASYFASAILLKRTLMVDRLKEFFALPTWQPNRLIDLIDYFNTTPETFCYRLSNLLPKYFGINQLLFVRFNSYQGHNRFDMTKEMHIGRKHNPHTVRDEHYCRRWLALDILQSVNTVEKQGVFCKAQISSYFDSKEQYFVISFAEKNDARPQKVSVTMGVLLDEKSRAGIQFLSDESILTREVNQTCERCGIFTCKERMAAPVVLQQRDKTIRIKNAIDKLIKQQ